MAKWKGIIVVKKYYKVKVDDAKDWTDAHNQMCDMCIAEDAPYDVDFEVYDIEEIKGE